MDTTGINLSVFVPEPKDALEIVQDSHTQFLFEGFKIHPRTERFPDDFQLIICEKITFRHLRSSSSLLSGCKPQHVISDEDPFQNLRYTS